MITTKTKLCISLSARPGGFGNLFHNFLYGKLGLDFIYKAGTTDDLKAAIGGMRALGIHGCGLSMPYKVEALPFVDDLEPKAREIGAINTIVSDEGRLTGFNTDFTGVLECLKQKKVDPKFKTALLGSGGMSRATAFALRQFGFSDVTIVSRNRETGPSLARATGYEWCDLTTLSSGYDFLVNTTSIGMGNNELAFDKKLIQESRMVMDVVTNLRGTPLATEAARSGIPTINGFDIVLAQGVRQFFLYTGVTLTPEHTDEAADFAKKELI